MIMKRGMAQCSGGTESMSAAVVRMPVWHCAQAWAEWKSAVMVRVSGWHFRISADLSGYQYLWTRQLFAPLLSWI